MTDEPERPLTFPFKAGGFEHLLVQRDGDVCLVQRGPWNFEVVLIQHRPAETFPGGKSYPPRETYPKPTQWGTAGWSYTTQANAEKRFRWQVDEARRKSRRATESGAPLDEQAPPFEEDGE